MTKRSDCLLAMLAALLAAAAASPAAAADSIFTVNSTADTGDATPDGACSSTCTLREAIQESNAVIGTNPVAFAIPGPGPHTIRLLSGLPTVTDTTTIDGYTEPGARPNTLNVGDNAVLRIRIDGADAGFAAALNITANDCLVRGLSLTGFTSSAAIVLSGADNTRIQGNFIGAGVGGTQAGLGNGWGIFLQADFSDPSDQPLNNLIGGTSPPARNLLSDNNVAGIEITSGQGNSVRGNYIGTTRSGTGDLGNDNEGVRISQQAANNAIGGRGRARNVIAFNGANGVEIAVAANTGNIILGNSIFGNGALGIDLGGNGVTPNDPLDPDSGPNNLQNFPVLTSAVTSAGETTIRGRLNSTPDTGVLIQFFSTPADDPSSLREGRAFLGETEIATNLNGNVTFVFRRPAVRGRNKKITATATDIGFNTSEFSKPISLLIR